MPLLFLLALLGWGAGPVSAALPATGLLHQTPCDDGAVRRDWEDRAANNPDDLDLQTLHTLWLGLCIKIQSWGLAVDHAGKMGGWVISRDQKHMARIARMGGKAS